MTVVPPADLDALLISRGRKPAVPLAKDPWLTPAADSYPSPLRTAVIPTPCAPLRVSFTDAGIVSLHFAPDNAALTPTIEHPHLAQLIRELAAYFAGTLRAFTVPLAPAGGTVFQRACWSYLHSIPFGITRSYGDQARAIGSPAAVRAVGQANGRNPLAILVPCHRVIGANGSLTGFGGGIDRKRWLLDHERRFTGLLPVPSPGTPGEG